MNAATEPRFASVWACGVGLAATVFALAPSGLVLPGAAALVVLAFAALWLLRSPMRWLAAFFVACLCLPPLPIAWGNSGPHPAVAVALIGLAAGIKFLPGAGLRVPRSSLALLLYPLALLASIPFAAWYSGPSLAASSAARLALFLISIYVFFYGLTVSRTKEDDRRLLKIVFGAAIISAAFACIDFFLQLPAPAGFGPQFIWIGSRIMRRGQGMFYEASSLGNFSVFFLLLTAACLLHPRDETPAPRVGLYATAGFFLTTLLISFSRASLISLAVGVAVLLALYADRRQLLRIASILGMAGLLAMAILLWTMPDMVGFLGVRTLASLDLLSSGSERVLSGRVQTWRVLTEFLGNHPQHLFFGVGYKTLPYSDFIGQITIADNAYLSALVETGLFGLGALLLMQFVLLRLAWKTRANLWSTWFLCFWAGETVQMFTGDLLTYWRLLPLYFWVLAVAIRNASPDTPVQPA